MILLRICREFGCLPHEIENNYSIEGYMELAVYLKICDDAEKKAMKKAEASAKARR